MVAQVVVGAVALEAHQQEPCTLDVSALALFFLPLILILVSSSKWRIAA
jgi:hypothetical protein